ncbi:MAG: DUF1287 domain-containing protein [Lachnospiraceae bacterium]|nr:DUF1287 domain-containing protein [Lachnospiraceae bacterium]
MKKHVKVVVAVLVALLVCGAGIGTYVYFQYQHTSTKRLPDRYDGKIERVRSSVDKDGDGVDDQTDILDGAWAYLNAKHPKYKSVYYADTGWSNDEYGVCTDVVANAMLAAGYNLQELVAADIEAHPEDYDIEKPDSMIDFRRVRNLIVYFRHTAISLTTDPSEILEWQGGDIVIYKSHIGIVSDRRNEEGIPYLIHHSGVWQARYEEDALVSWGEPIGHFRVSQ